ncbi:MAG: S8 family serine peptidase [Planctomycetes bacterium]|nr:S8 family serine peptidase [Planctomycetota bacterium]
MIVRPVQANVLSERGIKEVDIAAIRARAAARLAPDVIEYVPQTDEYIVSLPTGTTENEYAAGLLATGDYQYAEPDWLCFPVETIPNDGGYWQQWHHFQVRSSLAWDITTGDSNVIIAIVDGGVALDQPDLADALVPGYNAQDRIAQADGGDVSDVDGHGTFVAGIAGAIGNNGTHVVGMGWHFSIMPVRYYNGGGGGYLSNLLNGCHWAVEHGARCINVSQTGVENASVQTTGDYVRSQGGLLCWAAGNDARDLFWFDWADVTIVGASDQNDDRPGWSAYGKAVDVFAPGTDILSTGIEGGLAMGSGTSASTPVVSGIAGLIWSAHPLLPPWRVEKLLFDGCIDLGDPGDDPEWGHGRLDSFLAVSGSLVHTAAPVIRLQIDWASCPRTGRATLVASAGSGGNVAFVYSESGEGSFTIPNGNPCAGVELALAAPVVLLGTASGDPAILELARVPRRACHAMMLQAIDQDTCTRSNIALFR